MKERPTPSIARFFRSLLEQALGRLPAMRLFGYFNPGPGLGLAHRNSKPRRNRLSPAGRKERSMRKDLSTINVAQWKGEGTIVLMRGTRY